MSDKYKLQLPISKDLKVGIETIAKKEGFDSIQAFTRFLFTKVVNKEVTISIGGFPDEILSPEEDERLEKIYQEALKDRKAGKLKSFKTTKELFSYLDSL